MNFLLGVSSIDAITMYPEWDFKFGKKQLRTEHRTQTGKLYLYKWGEYDRFKFKLNWVSGTDATQITSWWESNTPLLFFVVTNGLTSVSSVYLMNKNSPLRQLNKPYDTLYKGTIELEGY